MVKPQEIIKTTEHVTQRISIVYGTINNVYAYGFTSIIKTTKHVTKIISIVYGTMNMFMLMVLLVKFFVKFSF